MKNRVVEHYESIDSTNTRAKAWAKEGALEGSVVRAEEQTAGRGRLGRTWASPKGEGLWMSLILRPHKNIEQIPQITLVTGLAMCKALREVTKMAIGIKWPNDLVVGGKKVCGILCEMVMEPSLGVIVGIGVNVNIKKFPDDLPYATSLYLEGGESYDKEKIVESFFHYFDEYYTIYKEENMDRVLEEYSAYCINIGNAIKVIENGQEYKAYALEIAQDGALKVKLEDETIKTIHSGEVSVRGLYGYID